METNDQSVNGSTNTALSLNGNSAVAHIDTVYSPPHQVIGRVIWATGAAPPVSCSSLPINYDNKMRLPAPRAEFMYSHQAKLTENEGETISEQ